MEFDDTTITDQQPWMNFKVVRGSESSRSISTKDTIRILIYSFIHNMHSFSCELEVDS